MAKPRTSGITAIRKGTSIGRNPKSRATMNKAKKRSFKKEEKF